MRIRFWFGIALAGAATTKCKPLDGVNVWGTIAEGKSSPRSEVVYNVEPFLYFDNQFKRVSGVDSYRFVTLNPDEL